MSKRIYVLFLVVLVFIFFVPVVFAASSASQAPKPYRPHNQDFNISDIAIQIYVTSPSAGAKWRVGTEKPILWTADPAKVGPQVKVLLMKAQQVSTADGQQAQIVIKDSWPSSGGFHWEIPENTPPGDYRIVVISKSNGKSGSSQPFRIIPQPIFHIIQPAANTTWEIGKSYTVKWSYSGEALGPLALLLFGSGGTRVDNIPLNGYSGDRSFLFTVPSTATAGPFALMLIEFNDEAKLKNDLLGYRGTYIAITVVREIIK
jgi:hypothetical protein